MKKIFLSFFIIIDFIKKIWLYSTGFFPSTSIFLVVKHYRQLMKLIKKLRNQLGTALNHPQQYMQWKVSQIQYWIHQNPNIMFNYQTNFLNEVVDMKHTGNIVEVLLIRFLEHWTNETSFEIKNLKIIDIEM